MNSARHLRDEILNTKELAESFTRYITSSPALITAVDERALVIVRLNNGVLDLRAVEPGRRCMNAKDGRRHDDGISQRSCAIDGIATGAVYALVAIGTVLIFTVTRVIFIPFGDIAAFTALTIGCASTPSSFPGLADWLSFLPCLRHPDGDVFTAAQRATFAHCRARCSSTSRFR